MAVVAVGHSLIVIAYAILARGTTFTDPDANFFDERDQEQVRRRLTRRLATLGYQVSVSPAV